MNRLHYIIDGYNLVHAIPSLKKTLAHNGESARELLIHSIGQLTHQRKFRCSIIFDGTVPKNFPQQSSHAPVHVIFSFPLNADAKIKQMIEQSHNRSLLVIISTDREVHNFARTYSCQTHTSKYFANLLSETDELLMEKPDPQLTKAQIDEWLKIFGKS